jgi:hypothetical protein
VSGEKREVRRTRDDLRGGEREVGNGPCLTTSALARTMINKPSPLRPCVSGSRFRWHLQLPSPTKSWR